MAEELTTWEEQLPGNMRRAPLDGKFSASFWSAMLYAHY